MKARHFIAAVAGVMAALAASASPASEWRVQLTPYVWAPGLKADIRPLSGAPTVTIKRSAGDMIGDLDTAFFISGMARRERLVLLTDFTWSAVSQSASATLPVFGPMEIINSRQRLSVLTLAGGYTLIDHSGLRLDAIVGARMWMTKASVGLPPLDLSFSDTMNWAEPLVGARARAELSPRMSAIAYGDAGGFGAGSESTWQFLVTSNYQLSDRFFLSAGYRRLTFDYRGGGRLLHGRLGGPLIGATWRF